MPRLVGINHVALEVGDVEAAVDFWRAIFPELPLAAREPGKAFLALGDQYLALLEGRTQERDARRHVGLVVDDLEAAVARARDAGAEMRRDRFFLDPWGNHVEVIAYADSDFVKAPEVLRRMGLEGL
ncbi:MAG: VOC family protein [Actinomycetota bacterium]|nr:VOC family protein [Actinomycetota bacterium]